MTFSFFLSIYSRCGAPASWALRHTTVCFDIKAIVQCYVVDICMSVCLVLLRALYGFVENVIVIRTRKK